MTWNQESKTLNSRVVGLKQDWKRAMIQKCWEIFDYTLFMTYLVLINANTYYMFINIKYL